MKKYSEQFKVALVEQYLTGEAGFTSVSREHGVPRSLLQRWVAFFRHHGSLGIRAKSVVYDGHFKLSVLRHMWENNFSFAQASAFFDIRDQCAVGKWQRSYDADGPAGLGVHLTTDVANMTNPIPKVKKPDPSIPDADKSKDDLLAELNWMRMEVAYRKKLDALVQAKRAATRSKRK
jgi:transposase